MPCQAESPAAVALQLVEQDTRADSQPLRLFGLENSRLERTEHPDLAEGVDPDRVEGGKVTRETTHERTTSAQLARAGESQIREKLS